MQRQRTRRMLAGSLAVTAAVAANAVVSDGGADAAGPNVVIISIDDQSAWALDLLLDRPAGPDDPVPNFRRLATDGVSFERAYAAAAVCNASRAAMESGLLPSDTGIFSNEEKVPSGEPRSGQWRPIANEYGAATGQGVDLGDRIQTIWQLLDTDYELAMVGKVNHNDQQQWQQPVAGKYQWPLYRGEYGGALGISSQIPVANQPVSGVTLASTGAAVTDSFGAGGLAAFTDWGFVVDHPHDGVFGRQFNPRPASNPVFIQRTPADPPAGVHASERNLIDYKLASTAVELLPQLRAEPDPYALAVGFFRPHLPFYVPSRFLEPYLTGPEWQRTWSVPQLPDDGSVATIYPGLAQGNYVPQVSRDLDLLGDPEIVDALVAHYLAGTSFVDEQLGRVLAELDAAGEYDDALIVLWSDHGHAIGQKDAFRKGFLYDSSARIPLMIKAPGQTSGGTSSAMASTLDLYPTIVDYTGVAGPTDGLVRDDGRSLRPYVDDPTLTTPLRRVVTQVTNEVRTAVDSGVARPFAPGVGPTGFSVALRSPDLTYFAHPSGTWPPAEGLFAATDVGETTNLLLADPGSADRFQSRAWAIAVSTP